MAGKKHFGNGTIQYTIKKAGLLDRPIYLTFGTEAEGDPYVARLEALLARGILPDSLRAPARIATIADLVREYERDAHPKKKDRDSLGVTLRQHGDVALANVTAAWVDDWIQRMKREEKLAPSTIRARVGAMARCTDWGMRKGHLSMPDHPLRTLPDGYAQYTKLDGALAGVTRTDVERDRRLEPGEFERVLVVIEGGVLPRGQRPLKLEHPDALRVLFVVAIETAMRLREIYTLTVDQVDLLRKTVFLDKTKNGDKRQVPLSSVALATFREYLELRVPQVPPAESVVFPWWSGSMEPRQLEMVSDQLSKLFHNNRSPGIFDAAGCVDLKFHDLRHEATSRLFERTTLSEAQIMKITGHKSHRMMMRYANLRGSDLAERLW